ncbi:Protein-lysine N-methyltransferase rrg1 [Rhizina undulata]
MAPALTIPSASSERDVDFITLKKYPPLETIEVDASEIPIHTVLDLPQLYTRPSSSTLLSALAHFEIPPPSWDGPQKVVEAPAGLAKWLTGIIASPLSWIQDDELQEEIWEVASKRMSERCGRSAMPPLTRTFRIPISSSDPVDEDSSVSISLYEPSLTADNLGLKTWASSYLLSKRVCKLPLPFLTSPPPHAPKALELGAGTGLVGLSVAATLKIPIVLTDLPEIVPNLERNIFTNAEILPVLPTAKILDWREIPQPLPEEVSKFDMVIAADPLYSEEHPRLLVGMVGVWLRRRFDARAVVEMPLRDGYEKEREDFRSRMGSEGLVVVEEGVEEGWDDWGVGGGEVRCWWSIWRWREEIVREVEEEDA